MLGTLLLVLADTEAGRRSKVITAQRSVVMGGAERFPRVDGGDAEAIADNVA